MDIEINHLSDINWEELETKENPRIIIDKNVYSIEDVKKINDIIRNIVSKAPLITNSNNKEKELFTYVYVLLSHLIDYDENAAAYANSVGYEREMTEKYVDEASGLHGLITGKSICSGYAKILSEVLYSFGIKSKIIRGDKGIRGTGHAWNQVLLDGVWYNCDLTNDHDFILAELKCPHFLKSNQNFTRLTDYPDLKTDINECPVSVSDEEQESLINKSHVHVNNLLNQTKQDEPVSVKNTFINKLKTFVKRSISSRKESRL